MFTLDPSSANPQETPLMDMPLCVHINSVVQPMSSEE